MKHANPHSAARHPSINIHGVIAAALCLSLSACAGVSPYGGALTGTDAEHLVLEGNAKTGAYRMEVTGLNQSRSTEKIAQTFENLTRLRIYSEVATTAIEETGAVAGDAVGAIAQ